MYGTASASTSHVMAATGANTTAATSSATAVIAWLSRASATSQFHNACRPAEASTIATAPALRPAQPRDRARARSPRQRRQVPGGRAARALPVQRRRVAELAELGRVAVERQADRPVGHEAQLAADAGHHRQVVR